MLHINLQSVAVMLL